MQNERHVTAIAAISATRKRNFGLDAIRTTAISLVIITHYATVSPVYGIVGVELFFVLSGFLIGGILYRTIQNQDQLCLSDLFSFWIRRWMRTLPNYYLFLCIFAGAAILITGNVKLDMPWSYLVFLQNLAWAPGSFYGISWSLAVEEWFYLLFPLTFFSIYFLAGRPKHMKSRIFVGAALFFIVLSTTLRLLTKETVLWAAEMRMVVFYRFDALMFGVILALIEIDCAAWWKRLQKMWPLGLIFLGAGAFIAARSLPMGLPFIPAAWLLSIIPLGCALTLPQATGWIASSGFVQGIVSYVSKSSYSMYLCHLPILWMAMAVGNDPRCGFLGKLFIRTSALFITVVCSGLLYQFFERPILSRAPKDPFPR